MTEEELQEEVIQLARDHNCMVFHSTDSRRDIGNGFPDLVVVGRHHVLFVELKSDQGQRTPAQTDWYWRLAAVGEYYALWRPKDLLHIEAVLREL